MSGAFYIAIGSFLYLNFSNGVLIYTNYGNTNQVVYDINPWIGPVLLHISMFPSSGGDLGSWEGGKDAFVRVPFLALGSLWALWHQQYNMIEWMTGRPTVNNLLLQELWYHNTLHIPSLLNLGMLWALDRSLNTLVLILSWSLSELVQCQLFQVLLKTMLGAFF